MLKSGNFPQYKYTTFSLRTNYMRPIFFSLATYSIPLHETSDCVVKLLICVGKWEAEKKRFVDAKWKICRRPPRMRWQDARKKGAYLQKKSAENRYRTENAFHVVPPGWCHKIENEWSARAMKVIESTILNIKRQASERCQKWRKLRPLIEMPPMSYN